MSLPSDHDHPEDVRQLGREFWRLTATHAPRAKIEPRFIDPAILRPDGGLRWTFHWSDSIDLQPGSASFDP